jgi:cysteine desulfurase
MFPTSGASAIDLDANATTPIDPDVLEAMRPHWLAGGNAESRHGGGRAARRAWDRAREAVAHVLGARADEVVFTSGGTEANNLALFGLAGTAGAPGSIVASPIEHPAVSAPLDRLAARGWRVERPEVGPDGVMDAAALIDRIDDRTRLATLMLANNETGALQPVAELAEFANGRGIPVHTDAAQAVGRIPVDFGKLGVATLAAGAHKCHGPGGVGVLLVRRRVRIEPLLVGGGQQGGLRPGTPPVALAVGMAAALEKWHAESERRMTRWRQLRDRLERGLVAALGPERVVRNGPLDDAARLPQTVNLGFPGTDGDALLMQLDLAGVRAALGSACASGSTQASPVLTAMRVPADRLRASVRFSLHATTTEPEIDEAIRRVAGILAPTARARGENSP